MAVGLCRHELAADHVMPGWTPHPVNMNRIPTETASILKISLVLPFSCLRCLDMDCVAEGLAAQQVK